MSPGEEISTNHLQAIAARLTRAEHQCRRFNRSFNHRQLASIEFEINDFPRLRFLASQMLLNFSFEPFLWQFDRFVQPGCTVKLFTVSASYFREFGCFRPPHLRQVVVNAARKLLVILIGLTNLTTSGRAFVEPKLNRRRALFVLDKVDEILSWERHAEQEKDTRFVELGQYLCEVRAGQYKRPSGCSG